MQPQQIEILNSVGVDLPVTMERFVGNEGLYLRCIGKFLKSEDYSNMLQAIAEGDATKAFECSHGLKGVAANLGLDNLFKAIQPLVEVFRAGRIDYDAAMLDCVKEEYKTAIEAIEKVLSLS